MRMALLAERIPAADAFDWGLVSAVYPADELDAEVDKVIATLKSGPAVALRKTKQAINAATLTELEGALERETEGQLALLSFTRLPRGHQGIPAAPARRSSPTTESRAVEVERFDECEFARRDDVNEPLTSTAGKSFDSTGGASHHRCVSTQFDIQQPVQVAGGWRVLAPFRFREYRLLIAAVSISIFAEGMWAVVMALQVIALDNDPASLSLVATCLASGLVAFVLVGGHRRRPDQPAHDHHRRRGGQRRRRVAVAVAGFAWRTADLAHGGGCGRRSASRRRSSSPPTARCCRGSFPPTSCWRPTASRAWCGRCSSGRSALRWPGSWSA